jgi:gas vesicle protein
MRHSDIFDEFAKIALANGLISEATPEQLQKKLEENPRWDSLDVSAIEALYGLKPDAPKDMEYKRNIVEIAHPKSVVVSPAHDKLNGLVENINERQDILLNIVKKPNNGHLSNKKYAEKQLLLTLVRIGNDLDNQKKEELRFLADVCLEQTATITKKATPLALLGVPLTAATIGWIALPIAVTLGAIYFQQHCAFRDEGFPENHNKLIAEIDDMLNSTVSFGVGNKYTQGFIAKLQELKSKISEIKSKYDQIFKVIEVIETPKTGKQLMELIKSPKNTDIMDAFNTFKEAMDDFRPYILTVTSNFKNETYKIRQVADKGVISKMVDWTGISHGGWGLIADDFDDVVRALGPYMKSLEIILDTLEKAKTVQQQAHEKLNESLAKLNPSQTETPKAEAPAPKPHSDNESDAKEFHSQLSNLGLPSVGT